MDISTGRPKSHIHTWIYPWISIFTARLLYSCLRPAHRQWSRGRRNKGATDRGHLPPF